MNWQEWLTPNGVKTIIELVLVLMACVTALLSLLGYKKQAGELQSAHDTIETHEDTIEKQAAQVANATKTAVALVQGVQKFRDGAAPDQAQAVKDAIQSVTTALGVEHIVQPLVKAATEGVGSAQDALAQPAPQPPTGTSS